MPTPSQLYQHAALGLDATTRGREQQAIERFTSLHGSPTFAKFSSEKSLVPNWGFIANGSVAALLCAGVNDLPMTLKTIEGWSVYTDVAVAKGWNTYARNLAIREIRPQIGSAFNDLQTWILVGHSLGGMVCSVMAWDRVQRGGPKPDLFLTMGSPRALATGYEARYVEEDAWRFFMVNDPIPKMPPRFEEAPALCLTQAALSSPFGIGELDALLNGAVVPAGLDLWQRFQHGEGMRSIDANGFSISLGQPQWSTFVAPAFNDIAGVFSAAKNSQCHLMSSYVAALYNWQKTASLAPIPLDPVPEKPGQRITVPEVYFVLPVNRGGDFVLPLEGVYAMPTRSEATHDTMPNANGPPLGALYLRAEFIASFPTRGKARTAARYLNRFLTRLNAAKEVSLSGMSQGINAYLQDAATGRGIDKKPVHLGP